MKVSELWLREWVDVPAAAAEIGERLLMAGLEVELEPAVSVVAQGVVVGRVEKVTPHPQADKLTVCEVDAGGERLQIVCGASNVRSGMRVPVALVGAKLPSGMAIKNAKLRGVDSAGMLCSAKELALAEKSEGLLELDPDATVGAPIAEHLRLADRVLALEITPNRGDCLSVMGLAREVAALYDVALNKPPLLACEVQARESLMVDIDDADGCPNYAGRMIVDVNAHARTPDWMRERLRRGGIRCIHPVVDVTNYVMLELGQPMHAFDAARLEGHIRVRRAKAGERLALLNEQTVELDPGDLLIADEKNPLALAGVMGGTASGVTADTTAIFFESACFAPHAVAASGRRHMLLSDARYRFERGVDPELQRHALERATTLVLEICGGRAGPITHAGKPHSAVIDVMLRHERLNALLGHPIPAATVEQVLQRLGIGLTREGQGAWLATIPSHRYDLRIEADLIEEVARVYGYDRLPAKPYPAQMLPAPVPEAQRAAAAAKGFMAARGYQEVVTYSFVEPKLQAHLLPGVPAIALDNPIAETLSAMRTTLWAGLIPAWLYNHQRQQRRVRLFELGITFTRSDGAIAETERLAGLAAGSVQPEQWGAPARPVDFFDVKADLEALLGEGCDYQAAEHPALHPGRSARVSRGGQELGWLGVAHPRLVRALDLPEAPVLFELAWEAIRDAPLPRLAPLSEFPSSRRDLALVLPDESPAGRVLALAREAGRPLLQQAFVFDVYRGQGLPKGFKSIALGLIFQDYSRTLTDEEAAASVARIATCLTAELGASIRGEGRGVDEGGAG